jgi:thiopeptide-type bacteriocin biosynthesis protein
VHDHIESFIKTGHVWKIQADTYNREYDRYGANMIDLAESIFHHDSNTVLDMLSKTWGDDREKVRWLWTMRSVDEMLNNFNYSTIRKRNLLEGLKDAFAKEFNADKFLKTQLNTKYRQHKKEIEKILDYRNDETGSLSPIIEVLAQRSENIRPLATQLIQLVTEHGNTLTIENLLGSYIHMLINRTIPAKQRLHELIIYDFLYRHYHSVIARETSAPALSSIQSS